MGQVERLVDDFLAREDRSRTWFSKRTGLNDKTLSSWFARGRQSPIPPGAIKAMARVLETDYRTVLDAALYDAGYLPASAVVDIRDQQQHQASSNPLDELFGPAQDDSPPPPTGPQSADETG